MREHLRILARLKLGDKSTPEQRNARVEELIQGLGLTQCANTIIGVPGLRKGISGGERKRLSFASEIMSDPSLLFMDEPTVRARRGPTTAATAHPPPPPPQSGLDSFMAETVVSALRDIANSGRTVIATIHQPPSEVYKYFDK